MSSRPGPVEVPLPDLAARLAADVERVAGRIRGLGLPRLARDLPPYGTVADAGRRAAQLLAALAQGVEQRADHEEPAWREVPRLPDHAVGDQVAVTGHDAVAAVRALTEASPATPATGSSEPAVWAPGGRRPAYDAVTAALDELKAIRLAID